VNVHVLAQSVQQSCADHAFRPPRLTAAEER
jgi:hypothetical protein